MLGATLQKLIRRVILPACHHFYALVLAVRPLRGADAVRDGWGEGKSWLSHHQQSVHVPDASDVGHHQHHDDRTCFQRRSRGVGAASCGEGAGHELSAAVADWAPSMKAALKDGTRRATSFIKATHSKYDPEILAATPARSEKPTYAPRRLAADHSLLLRPASEFTRRFAPSAIDMAIFSGNPFGSAFST